MDIYVVRLDPPKPKLQHKAIEVALLSGGYLVLMLLRRYFWPSLIERHRTLPGMALELVLVSLLWGLCMAFFPRKFPSYKLLVDDDSITGVTQHSGWMSWWVTRRTISKGKVRTELAIKGRLGMPAGMGFSERGRLGTRIFGFVYMPSSLPDYEYLKTLAESWRTPNEMD